MIRFLLDMGIAQSTGHYLTSQGHDVVHLSEQGLERLPDDRIIAKAQEEERAIITHDLDFGRIVAFSGRSVPSIVALRLSDMTPRRVYAALGTALREATLPLESGALVTVTDSGIRVLGSWNLARMVTSTERSEWRGPPGSPGKAREEQRDEVGSAPEAA